MNSRYCWIVILCLHRHQRVLSGTSSQKRIDVSAIEGENVTLRVQEKRPIKDISWITGNMDHFATTTPDGNVNIRETRYKGRLRWSDNASLTIINVTLEDKGPYTGNILLSDGDLCLQMYNLSILAQLPDNNAVTEASIPDPCSVSCRIDGLDVILTCGNTSSRDITELYDPEICSCVTRNSDCSNCILEESCREAKLPDNNAVTEASIPDPCSVSCRINGSDVTCGNTNGSNITELYDPEICSCVTRNPDCSRCILEKYCREDDNTGRSSFWVLLLLALLIFVVVLLIAVLSRKKDHSVKKPSVFQKLIHAVRIPFCSERLKPSGDQEDLESARTSIPTTNVPKVKTAVTPSGDQEHEEDALLMRNMEIISEVAGQSTVIQNGIKIMPGVKVNLIPYRLPGGRSEAISKMKKIQELPRGVIEDSHSGCSSTFDLTLKKVSRSDVCRIPRITHMGTVMERQGTAQEFTTLGLTKRFWQVVLPDKVKEKTAFSTPRGLFKYIVLPFRLYGTPFTFERMIDTILRPTGRYAAPSLYDNIIGHSPDCRSHLPRVQEILDSIREPGMMAKPKKCIGIGEVKYLGNNIVRDLLKQLNLREAINRRLLRASLGITGCYQRSIPNFAISSDPFTYLNKWKQLSMMKCIPKPEKTFQALKQGLCTQSVLFTLDYKEEFIIQTCTSNVIIGTVPYQNKEWEEHPAIYGSRKCNDQKHKYAIEENEGLENQWSLETLGYYFLGRPFKLITDHTKLISMYKNLNKNGLLSSFSPALQNVKFTVELVHWNAQSQIYNLGATCVLPPSLKKEGGICVRSTGNLLYNTYLRPRVRKTLGNFSVLIESHFSNVFGSRKNCL